MDRDEALQKFTQLTDQAIAFLVVEVPDKSAAREIGGNLASLRCIEPEVIEATGQLWARQVVECASRDEIAQLYPRLVVLLNGMATGFIIGARQVVLDEQEQIRLAMATNLLRTTEELRKYQLHLETMLEDRTRDLQESEERFRLIAETSLDGIFQSTGPSGRLIFVNDALGRMLGFTKEELLGRNTRDLMAEEDFPKLTPIAQNVARNKPVHGEYRLKHKAGHLIHVHFSVVPMKLKGELIRSGIMQDITERKRAEEALRDNEQRLSSIYETVGDVIFYLAVETEGQYRFISVNPSFYRITGLSQDQIIGKTVTEVIPEPSLTMVLGKYRQAIEAKTIVHWVEISDYPTGRLTGEVSIAPVFDDKGRCTHLVGSVNDITERKRAEEALSESEERYRMLAEATHDMIFSINRDDRIEYVNSFAARSIGLQPAGLIGQPRGQFFSKRDNKRFKNSLEQVIKSGEAKCFDHKVLFPVGALWLSTWLIPLRDSSGNIKAILGVSRDITDRKQVEASLQRAKNELEKRVAERTASLSASQEKLRKLTQQIVSAQEEERRRVSRELHDEAGQVLITLKYSLDSVINELPDNLLPISQHLSEAIARIDQMSERMRSLSHSLRPPVLDIAGINLSLKDYCREFSKETKIPLQYRGEDIPGLPDAVGI
ncbi:MAG: PAS domain S-box protein, partial [Anaerolineales bacterium]|nr:PAS domain S-box protein [Anaerolineales bacterium]